MVTDQVKRGTTARKPSQKLGRPRAMTKAEIIIARRMLADGVKRKIIAQSLKVSLSIVYIALRPEASALSPSKSVGRPRVMTEIEINLARRMLAKGITRKIIAETLRVSPSTLITYLRPYSAGPHPQMGRPKISGSGSQPGPTTPKRPRT
jgi:DNA invertase Pin-like site-specific DNA recombinase